MTEQFGAHIEAQAQAVAEHFAEMRDFTVYHLTSLRTSLREEMHAGFARLDSRIDKLDGRIDTLDGRVGRIERRLDRHEDLLGQVLSEVRKLNRD